MFIYLECTVTNRTKFNSSMSVHINLHLLGFSMCHILLWYV
jgi:hypothetical protein